MEKIKAHILQNVTSEISHNLHELLENLKHSGLMRDEMYKQDAMINKHERERAEP